jgi:energy-coupling factor transporter ATP-binding protein EcfA2
MAVVRRIEIRGGFLDDLDLELSPGLNVLIGSRGSGKTSLLEILRFAFGVPAITPQADEKAKEHALSVLGDGGVTVTLRDGGEDVVVQREANVARAGEGVLPSGGRPLIVSQSEIEHIGLNERSRLQILDGLTDRVSEGTSERALLQSIDAETDTIAGYVESLDRLKTRLLELSSVVGELAAAEAEATGQTGSSQQMTAAQERLKALTQLTQKSQKDEQRAVDLSERSAAFEEALAAARAIGEALADRQPPNDASRHVTQALELLGRAEAETAQATIFLEEAKRAAIDRVLELRRSLRDEGSALESLQEGAGELARKLTRLREQDSERQSVDSEVKSLEERLATAQTARSDLLDQVDALRSERFARRQQAAAEISALFNGEIEIRISKGGLFRDYEVALAEALEGSNLQYKSLAQQLVQRISPRELVEAVERGDADSIATVGQITHDRATRLVSHLRAKGCGGILTVPLEDMVDFALLDGQVFKTTAQLSTGQRCTVVLPLLLAQSAQLTILDQPEDHLDNAFIVDTLIRAVLRRKETSQLLIATHNANIPVLGDADEVIVLSSDGRHGAVDRSGALTSPDIVDAITALMEGGEEAFRRRAAFYAEHA